MHRPPWIPAAYFNFRVNWLFTLLYCVLSICPRWLDCNQYRQVIYMKNGVPLPRYFGINDVLPRASSFWPHRKNDGRVKVTANVYGNFRRRNNRENSGRRNSWDHLITISRVSPVDQARDRMRDYEWQKRAEQIPTLQTVNNSLSVAARIVSQNGRIYDAISRRVIKKRSKVNRGVYNSSPWTPL